MIPRNGLRFEERLKVVKERERERERGDTIRSLSLSLAKGITTLPRRSQALDTAHASVAVLLADGSVVCWDVRL